MMVEEKAAWKSKDGTLWETRDEAIINDARVRLEVLGLNPVILTKTVFSRVPSTMAWNIGKMIKELEYIKKELEKKEGEG